MCVTSAKAHLDNTVVGGWDIQHPTYGYRHVLAYQNSPKNLASGANCMLLHIPATADLVPSDLVDTSAYPNILYDIVKTLIPPPSQGSRSLSVSPKNHVIEMGVYHVALLNDLSSTALRSVLNQIPVSKRPIIASVLLEFYVEKFPNYRLVLACFDNKNLKTASAIMLHYEPMFPNKIFFPLLEGHDGKVPRIGQHIRMHQQIIYGSVSRIESTLLSLSVPSLPETLLPFLPKYIGYQSFDGKILTNNDDWLDLNSSESTKTITQSISSQEEALRLKEINLKASVQHTLLDKSIIRDLIRNGNTEKVLLQLQKAGYPKATISYDKYKEKAKLMQMGTLEMSEWYALQKQLYEDILTWEYLEETKPPSLLTEAEKLNIRQSIQTNQTDNALNLCKDLGDQPVILLGYYTRIMKGRELNMLTESEKDAYLTEINEAIEKLIA